MHGVALFATPVFSFDNVGSDDLDRELCDRLVAESERSPGVARSNSGGWHSVPDLTQRKEACFQEVMRRIVGHVQTTFHELSRGETGVVDLRYRFAMQAWAMVMRHGDHALVHDHPEAHFSVAYYPDAGDSDPAKFPDSGKLTFVDPRRGGTQIPGVTLFPTQFAVTPKTSTLVVFPGWLQHFVQPYRGGRPRVSVSCNVRVEPDLRT